jgi:hypothetical protein
MKHAAAKPKMETVKPKPEKTEKPEKEILTLEEALTLSDAVKYPLKREINQLIECKASVSEAEERLKGKFVGKVQVSTGLVDRILQFMQEQQVDVILVGEIQVTRYKSSTSYLDAEKLMLAGVTPEQIEAGKTKREYETITVRAAK